MRSIWIMQFYCANFSHASSAYRHANSAMDAMHRRCIVCPSKPALRRHTTEIAMLYDIFYADRSMDSSTRLPARAERGAYAVNVNGDGHVYVAKRGKWVIGRRAANGKFVAA
jgi:hypothetical protein